MEFTEVQATEVMVGLKSGVSEAPNASEETASKVVDTSKAINAGGTSINMNLFWEDVFDYSTFNKKSPTPSPIPPLVHSHIHLSSPIVEPIGD